MKLYLQSFGYRLMCLRGLSNYRLYRFNKRGRGMNNLEARHICGQCMIKSIGTFNYCFCSDNGISSRNHVLGCGLQILLRNSFYVFNYLFLESGLLRLLVIQMWNPISQRRRLFEQFIKLQSNEKKKCADYTRKNKSYITLYKYLFSIRDELFGQNMTPVIILPTVNSLR